LSTTNPTWPDPGSNLSRRGGKPATNRLSYGAAKLMHETALWDHRLNNKPEGQSSSSEPNSRSDS
jgi:hypothetical protein